MYLPITTVRFAFDLNVFSNQPTRTKSLLNHILNRDLVYAENWTIQRLIHLIAKTGPGLNWICLSIKKIHKYTEKLAIKLY